MFPQAENANKLTMQGLFMSISLSCKSSLPPSAELILSQENLVSQQLNRKHNNRLEPKRNNLQSISPQEIVQPLLAEPTRICKTATIEKLIKYMEDSSFNEILKRHHLFFWTYCLKFSAAETDVADKEFAVIQLGDKIKITGMSDRFELLVKTLEIWRRLLVRKFEDKEDLEVVIALKDGHYFFRERKELIDLRKNSTEEGCSAIVFIKQVRPILIKVLKMLGANYAETISQQLIHSYSSRKEPSNEDVKIIQIRWNMS